MRWYWDNYLGTADDLDRRSPELSPRYAADLRGLPDTLILSCGYDPLTKDEAQAYADQLERAGTDVCRLRYPATIHGFLRFRGALEVARTAALDIGSFVHHALR
jgi:acetyl esterase